MVPARRRGYSRGMSARTAPSQASATGHVSSVISAAGAVSAVVVVGAVLVALAASWAATWLMGGAGAVAPHWFYVPVVLAAARFGVVGAVLTGAVAGVLAGPLMPLDVGDGTAQVTSDWVSRTGFFVGLGALMAVLIRGALRARADVNAVARREHELVRRKVEFIEGVSHEFRTPLTVIAGTVEILSKHELAPGDRRDLVDALRQNVDRLTTLIEILVTAGEMGVDSGEPPRVTDLDATLWRQREELHRVLDAPERLRISSSGPTEVMGDRRLVSIAVLSVVDNALRYSRHDTPVDGVIEGGTHQVRLVVRDRGPGIDEGVARRALETPVTRNDRERPGAQGLGVGLFATAQVMQRIGGAVEVSPGPGGGTEVVLTFRAADDPGPPKHGPGANP